METKKVAAEYLPKDIPRIDGPNTPFRFNDQRNRANLYQAEDIAKTPQERRWREEDEKGDEEEESDEEEGAANLDDIKTLHQAKERIKELEQRLAMTEKVDAYQQKVGEEIYNRDKRTLGQFLTGKENAKEEEEKEQQVVGAPETFAEQAQRQLTPLQRSGVPKNMRDYRKFTKEQKTNALERVYGSLILQGEDDGEGKKPTGADKTGE